MFGFFSRKKSKKDGPVVYGRPDHCISRKNIDQSALDVLYALSRAGYKAYLVGGGVRDLLLGRTPKDFDVGTDATPDQVIAALRHDHRCQKRRCRCFKIGKRFTLVLVRFGNQTIETSTFRGDSQTVGDILERARTGGAPASDNNFDGTPETDANRRDFTVNALFYDIKDFSLIDYVGGLSDLRKGVLRAVGDPDIRFQDDPVRMMRAVKFASRLGFKIEKRTEKAIRAHHHQIVNAAVPRVLEEIFRLFTFSTSEKAFRMMFDYGLLGDLLPELAAFIESDGGRKSSTWTYLAQLDRYDAAMTERGYEVSNGLRVATLFAAMAKANPGRVRDVVGALSRRFKIPKVVYFTAVMLIESVKRFAQPPEKRTKRFVYHQDFLDALDFSRIVARAEGRDEKTLDAWDELSRQLSKKQGESHE